MNALLKYLSNYVKVTLLCDIQYYMYSFYKMEQLSIGLILKPDCTTYQFVGKVLVVFETLTFIDVFTK